MTVFRHKKTGNLYERSILTARASMCTGDIRQFRPLNTTKWINESSTGMYSDKNFSVAYIV